MATKISSKPIVFTFCQQFSYLKFITRFPKYVNAFVNISKLHDKKYISQLIRLKFIRKVNLYGHISHQRLKNRHYRTLSKLTLKDQNTKTKLFFPSTKIITLNVNDPLSWKQCISTRCLKSFKLVSSWQILEGLEPLNPTVFENIKDIRNKVKRLLANSIRHLEHIKIRSHICNYLIKFMAYSQTTIKKSNISISLNFITTEQSPEHLIKSIPTSILGNVIDLIILKKENLALANFFIENCQLLKNLRHLEIFTLSLSQTSLKELQSLRDLTKIKDARFYLGSIPTSQLLDFYNSVSIPKNVHSLTLELGGLEVSPENPFFKESFANKITPETWQKPWIGLEHLRELEITFTYESAKWRIYLTLLPWIFKCVKTLVHFKVDTQFSSVGAPKSFDWQAQLDLLKLFAITDAWNYMETFELNVASINLLNKEGDNNYLDKLKLSFPKLRRISLRYEVSCLISPIFEKFMMAVNQNTELVNIEIGKIRLNTLGNLKKLMSLLDYCPNIQGLLVLSGIYFFEPSESEIIEAFMDFKGKLRVEIKLIDMKLTIPEMKMITKELNKTQKYKCFISEHMDNISIVDIENADKVF